MAEIANALLRGDWPASKERKFRRDMYFAPGWRDWRRGFMRDLGGPPNIDPGGDYNYRLAWEMGAAPEVDPGTGEVHGLSSVNVPPYRNPVDLKDPNHPTYWKEDFVNQFGVNPDIAVERGETTPEMDRFIGNALKNALTRMR